VESLSGMSLRAESEAETLELWRFRVAEWREEERPRVDLESVWS
jgi:hypothetical protein